MYQSIIKKYNATDGVSSNARETTSLNGIMFETSVAPLYYKLWNKLS